MAQRKAAPRPVDPSEGLSDKAAGRITLRIDFGPLAALGPGKIRLLEEIAGTGSITQAGRAMDMSYRRSWVLVDELNQMFHTPVVATQHGGAKGGGAVLTAFGHELVARYRAAEREAAEAVAGHLAFLRSALK